MDANKGVALVTGASRGLGRAIAIELAARGFDVIAGMRNLDDGAGFDAIAADLQGTLRAQRLDICDLDDFVVPEGLEVLVNNAGYRGPYLPVEETPLDEWRRTFETNVFGVVELTRRVIPAMRRAGTGVICNIGSTSVQVPMPFFSTYRSSKAALEAVSEGLRIELAPFGIRVIEIPIGGVETDMLATSVVYEPPAAIKYEAYRPMAERQYSFASSAVSRVIPPAEAACNVVDAILSDKGGLSQICDANAEATLSSFGALPREELLQNIMDQFGAKMPER